MRRRALIIILLIGTVAIAGCVRTQPIYNVSGARLATAPGIPPRTVDEVAKAIWMAGKKLGWQIDEVRPGELTGTLKLRSHVAVMSIVHDQSTFSIKFKNGTNLLYESDRIHRNYNKWIQKLERQIQAEIAAPPRGSLSIVLLPSEGRPQHLLCSSSSLYRARVRVGRSR